MSWDYWIISADDAARLSERITAPHDDRMESGNTFEPTVSLGAFRAIYDWLTSHATEWHPREADSFTVTLGPKGYALLRLRTARYSRIRRDKSDMQSYAPDDNEGVLMIFVEGRGEGDCALLAECAAWLNAVIFNCQTDDILTPQEWMRQICGIQD